MVEAVLVMLPLAFFLFLGPALWNIWVAEHHARVRAHRDTFLKVLAQQTGGINASVPVFAGGFGTSSPKKPPKPKLKPKPDKSLQGYLLYPNVAVEGRWREEVVYSNGFAFGGTFPLARHAYTLRAPWTYSAWPFVPKTTTAESKKVRSWFKKAYLKTLNQKRWKYTRIDRKPVQ